MHDYQAIADSLAADPSETNIAAAIAALADVPQQVLTSYRTGVESICGQLATELPGDFTQNEKNKVIAAIPAMRAAAGI